MPFKYSCFISYCHGHYELMTNFVTQIKCAFESCLEPFFNQEVYIDESRLKPGYHYNEGLSRAICQSFCMIVIYTPTYESHSYCLREYLAMERLEQERLHLLENQSTDMGMIIPIILRGDMKDSSSIIKSKIKDGIHYCDFSKFSLSNMDITDSSECINKIDHIATEIYSMYQLFEDCNGDPCHGCNSFSLPSEDEVRLWKNNNVPPFPGREE